MNVIEWANSNQGFLMVVLTAVYAITTIGMFRSNNKMLKLSTKQKEQERVIASLDLIRRLNEICNTIPASKADAYAIKEKLNLMQAEVSALGGIEANIALKRLFDLYNALYKTTDMNAFVDININQELSRRHLDLEAFFRSEAVANQGGKYKKTLWQKVCKKQPLLDMSRVGMAFQYGWGADTSRYGVLGVPASKGQCAVTAMIIQDYFGGDIYKIKVDKESHYFNIVNNQVIDLTADQFFQKIDYKDKIIANRDNFEQETINRYLILKSRVEPFLITIGVLKKVKE